MLGIIRFPNKAHPKVAKALKIAIPETSILNQVKPRNPLRLLETLDQSWPAFLDHLTDSHARQLEGARHPYHHRHIEEMSRATPRWMRLRLRYEMRARTIVSKLRSAGLCAGATWNGQVGDPAIIARALRSLGLPVLYGELSPFKGRYFLDHVGVNAASSLQDVRPEHLKPYADEAALFDGLRGSYMGRRFPGVTFEDPRTLPRTFVFAPLQVPLDTQMLLHGGPLRRQSDYIRLLGEVAGQLPENISLVVKPHPEAPYPEEYLRKAIGRNFIIGRSYETRDLLERCLAVVTVNSSVGPDAFLFDKPVIALGRAPWIKPSLALKVENASQMSEAITKPPSVDRALRQRFLAHWYHAYTFPIDGDPAALRSFVESKIALAKSSLESTATGD